MDRILLSGAFALLFLEVSLLLGDLGVLPFDPLHLRPATVLTREIGTVVSVNQNVRRKSQSSLIWESSTPKDQLYAFDSLLTLANSSAKVHLQGDVQLQLNENTLVVLEPLSEEKRDHLRLRFTRGTMRSRTGGQNLKVAAGEWTLDAQSGSDISLRSLEGGHLELEVSSGQVALNKVGPEPSSQAFQAGEKLTLSEESIQEVVKVAAHLKWEMPGEMLRVYSYQFPAFVSLQWLGEAEQLRIVNQAGQVSLLKLASEQRSITLPLLSGTHYVNLQHQSTTSPTFPVSVWPAEGLHYLSPLPRDRIPLGSMTTFSWSPSRQAKSYRLQISATEDFSTLTTDEPIELSQLDFALKDAGNLYWRVVGVDDDGFLIPPLYAQLFYGVDRPLAAPKLRAPAPRLPASRNPLPSPPSPPEKPPAPKPPPPEARSPWPRIWNWVFPQAQAQTEFVDQAKAIAQEAAKASRNKPRGKKSLNQQVVFSWYPVPEADYYVIEISPSPDFASPVVAQKINKEEFLWSQFEKRTYYWRVAAGQENGRMGLFSEASEVDLARLNDQNLSELAPGVSVVTTPEPPPPSAKPVTETPLAATEPPPPPPPMAPPPVAPLPPPAEVSRPPLRKVEQEHSFRFLFAPETAQIKQTNQDHVAGQLNGSSQVTIESDLNFPLEEKGRLGFQFRFSTYEWEPKAPSQVPLQDNLASWNLRARLMHFPARRNWGYGFAVHRSALLERAELEVARFKEHLTYGASLAYIDSLGERSQWETSLWVTSGSSVLATQLTTRVDYRYPAWGIVAIIGLGLDGILESGEHQAESSGGTASLRIGFEW